MSTSQQLFWSRSAAIEEIDPVLPEQHPHRLDVHALLLELEQVHHAVVAVGQVHPLVLRTRPRRRCSVSSDGSACMTVSPCRSRR